MKNVFLVVALAFLVAVPAFAASWTGDIAAAAAANNFEKINRIAARYPEQQGDIAMYLLPLARQNLAADPERAARLFDAASLFVSEIPAASSADAAAIIKTMLLTAQADDFQTKNAAAASIILAVAFDMSAQPNIKAAMPDLHDEVMKVADNYLAKNPQDVSKLRQRASLAVAPGSAPPSVGTIGARQTSAD